jgi:hypothetical protein
MAKSEYVYWQGKGKYIRPWVSNQWGDYSMVLYPTEESLTDIRRLVDGTDGKPKIKTALQKDDDGFYLRLKRPMSKTYGNKVIGFEPPLVVDNRDIPFRDSNIGDGSDVTCKVMVYNYGGKGSIQAGRAIRWEAMKVENLIPYSKGDFTDREKYMARGLDEQPLQENPGF